MPYGSPPSATYGRTPVIPPWLTGTLVVGGGLAVGALVSHTAMAAMKKVPLPLPTPSKEPVMLGVQRVLNQDNRPHATYVSTDPRVSMIEEGQGAFVTGPLPLRVMVSVPEDMEVAEAIAVPEMGGKLLAGDVGTSKDFLFEVSQYSAQQALPDNAGSENYNAIVTVKYAVENMTVTIPMPIYTAPG